MCAGYIERASVWPWRTTPQFGHGTATADGVTLLVLVVQPAETPLRLRFRTAVLRGIFERRAILVAAPVGASR